MNDQFMNESRFFFHYDRRDTSLSVCSVGSDYSSAGYLWGPGSRSYYFIMHVVEGEAVFHLQGKRFLLQKGDTFVAYPKMEQIIESKPNQYWEYFWVGFQGGEAATLLSHLGFSPTNPVIHTGTDAVLRTLQNEIYKTRSSALADSTAMTGWLYLIFSHLLSKYAIESRDEEEDPFFLALQFIHQSFMTPISAIDVCAHVGMSRSGLYRLFMRNIGISVNQYICEQRVNRACRELNTTDTPVAAIAMAVGYQDPLYFSRIFKQKIGVSPMAYRRANQSRFDEGKRNP